jgi:hypothetical protein
VKLLLNEMWSSKIAIELRRRGLDVVSATEVGVASRYSGVPDDEVLWRAQEDSRAVVTDNIADFSAIHTAVQAQGRTHLGIVFALRPHFDRSQPGIIGVMVRSLERFLRVQLDRGALTNQVHYLRRL